MTQVKGTTKQEFVTQELSSQEVPKQSVLKTLGSITRIMLKNPSAFRKLRFIGSDETRYIRPPRRYEIPPFHKGMKYCSSHEPYLRPTRWCNPREPEVVAMASELGSYELSDYEFAEAAYWFVKTKMSFEICPFDSAGATLKRGTGSCYHLINVFIALCRAAGIKARYKNYKMRLRGIEQSIFIDVDPMMTELYELGGGVIAEGEGEACIDGKWTVAYVAQNAAASAAAGWPITTFGEDSIGLYFDALPESVKRFESLPLQLGLGLRFMGLIAPATMERMNVSVHMALTIGQQEIEEAGGVEKYDQKARKRRERFSVDEILNQQMLKHSDKIIFKKE
jgi:hypothetical protein